MPIYEYVCKTCEVKLEAFQGIHDLPLTECRVCHQPTLEKLVSASLFRLKGSGWYETDFKKDHDKKKNLVNEKTEAASTTATSTPEAAAPAVPTTSKTETSD